MTKSKRVFFLIMNKKLLFTFRFFSVVLFVLSLFLIYSWYRVCKAYDCGPILYYGYFFLPFMTGVLLLFELVIKIRIFCQGFTIKKLVLIIIIFNILCYIITGEESKLIRILGVKSLTLTMLIPDIILLLLVYIKLKRKSVKHNNHK